VSEEKRSNKGSLEQWHSKVECPVEHIRKDWVGVRFTLFHRGGGNGALDERDNCAAAAV
jgi:hypothetical protein